MDRELLLSTGLTQTELGKLFGVTRITVLGWMKGRFGPHRLHRESVASIVELLDNAVKAGKLPLPSGIGKPARLAEVRRIIGLTD